MCWGPNLVTSVTPEAQGAGQFLRECGYASFANVRPNAPPTQLSSKWKPDERWVSKRAWITPGPRLGSLTGWLLAWAFSHLLDKSGTPKYSSWNCLPFLPCLEPGGIRLRICGTFCVLPQNTRIYITCPPRRQSRKQCVHPHSWQWRPKTEADLPKAHGSSPWLPGGILLVLPLISWLLFCFQRHLSFHPWHVDVSQCLPLLDLLLPWSHKIHRKSGLEESSPARCPLPIPPTTLSLGGPPRSAQSPHLPHSFSFPCSGSQDLLCLLSCLHFQMLLEHLSLNIITPASQIQQIQNELNMPLLTSASFLDNNTPLCSFDVHGWPPLYHSFPPCPRYFLASAYCCFLTASRTTLPLSAVLAQAPVTFCPDSCGFLLPGLPAANCAHVQVQPTRYYQIYSFNYIN